MKRTLERFVLPLVLSVSAIAQTGAAAAPATPAAATGPATTKIGIINIQKAIVLTNEGKRDLDALEKKFAPKQTELQGMQKEIADMQSQLKTQGDKLNEDARAKLVRDIETKNKSFQRSAEDAQQDFQAQQGELVNRIGGKLMEVLDKYAKDHGFSMIVDVSSQSSNVLWAAANTDVTDEIAQAYNAQSSVAAPPSAPAPNRPGTAANRPPSTPAKPATGTSTPK
jgi:outer membrane protein